MQTLIRPVGGCAGPSAIQVLLLPGLGFSGEIYRDVMANLSAEHGSLCVLEGPPVAPLSKESTPLITMEQLGAATVDALSPSGSTQGVVVVGHSAACFLAMEVARLLGRRCVGVLLLNGGLVTVARWLDSPLRSLGRKGWRTRAAFVALVLGLLVPVPGALRAAVAGNELVARVLLGHFVARPVLADDRSRATLASALGHPRLIRSLTGNRHHWAHASQTARTLRTRVILLAGADDPLAPPVECEELTAIFPSAEMRVLAGAKHCIPLEEPAAVAEAVRALALG